MEVQELPDYKAYRSEIDKYLDEPLFEYVWKVADCFLPVVDYDGEPSESQAPIIFANRYIESKLTDEEKYIRFIEFFPDNNLDSAKKYHAERARLDTSFKDTFFNDKEVQTTLKAFHIDSCKFWYLLLFVNDVVKDVCTNAPSRTALGYRLTAHLDVLSLIAVASLPATYIEYSTILLSLQQFHAIIFTANAAPPVEQHKAQPLIFKNTTHKAKEHAFLRVLNFTLFRWKRRERYKGYSPPVRWIR